MPDCADGNEAKPKATLELPVKAVVVQQWMCAAEAGLTKFAKVSFTLTCSNASSKSTAAKPVPVDVGVGSPTFDNVAPKANVVALAGRHKDSEKAVADNKYGRRMVLDSSGATRRTILQIPHLRTGLRNCSCNLPPNLGAGIIITTP